MFSNQPLASASASVYPAPITQTPGEDLTLHGVRLVAGQPVLIALGDIARDEHLFLDPQRFNPRRWLTSPKAGTGRVAMAPPTPVET